MPVHPKSLSHDELKDRYLGERGTPDRDHYERELQTAMLGNLIRQTRKKAGLTQEKVGQKVGIQKTCIARMEKDPSAVPVSTLIAVLNALNAKIVFQEM